MKKIIKTSFSILIILAILLSSVITSFAIPTTINDTVFVAESTYTIKNGSGTIEKWQNTWDYGNNPHYKGDLMYWMWAYNSESDWINDRNGWTCYCLEPGKAATLGNGYTYTFYSKWNDLPNEKKSIVMGILANGLDGNSSALGLATGCSSSEKYMATQLAIWDICCGYRTTNNYRLTTTRPTIYYANNCSCVSGNLTVTGGTYPALTKAYNFIFEHLYKYDNVKSGSSYYITPTKPTFSYDTEADAKTNKKQALYDTSTSSFTLTLTSTNAALGNGCLDLYMGGSYPIVINNQQYTRTYKGENRTSYISTSLVSNNSQQLKVTITGDPIASDEPFTYKIFTGTTDKNKSNLKTNFMDSHGSVICTAVADSDQFQNILVAASDSYIKNRTAYISLYTDEPFGKVELQKISNIPKFTDENSCYSLENAKYGVYSDSQCTAKVGELITDENGNSNILELKTGTYYIKEIEASKGYALDKKSYSVSVLAGRTTITQVKENPQSDPIGLILTKKNETTEKYKLNIPIKDAEYKFSYYPKYYDKVEDIDMSPTLTYVLKTDEEGWCELSENYKVSGSEFYYIDDVSFPVLPLGTLVIKEVTPPKGFYLDETIYLRHITPTGNEVIVNTYNAPTSNEFEILNLEIKASKVWIDDNDRDGIRPKNVTINLLQDNKVYKTATLSDSNDWTYIFKDVPEACIDVNAENYRHYYTYSIQEVTVDGYKVKSSGIIQDPDQKDDIRKKVCNITNTHEITKIDVNGTKTWNDFNNCMKYRPYNIKINLFGNNEYITSKTVTSDDNWKYTFTNLPKYYDHGKEINYTVTEDYIEKYTASINKMNVTNNLITGSVKLTKNDGWLKPLEGVKFKLYTKDNKPVSAIKSENSYNFQGLNKDTNVDFVTDNDGIIKISNLPLGEYYFIETEAYEGYMPYEGHIEFSIENENEIKLNPEVTVKNNKALMYNTGSFGNIIIYIVAAVILILAIIMLYFYKQSDKKQKNKNKNKQEIKKQ